MDRQAGFMNGHPEWKDANQKPYSALEWEPVFVEQPDGSKTMLPPPERNPAPPYRQASWKPRRRLRGS